ncbi:MAG: TrmB family transcriptional regulator sugar-binding domain-containing protein [Candidatus Aenigmatarchaeota archaeon]
MQKDHEAMIERIDRLKGSSVMNELEGIFKQGLSFIQSEEITGTLKGRNNINRQLQSLFRSAKKDIFVLTTERGLKDIHSNHFRILKKVVKRGVKLKILAPQTNAEMLKMFSQIADVKPIKQASGMIYVVDGEHVVVSLTDDKVHESQDIAFWANSSHTAKDVILPYLNHLLKG